MNMTDNNYHPVISDILRIIGYQGDRKHFEDEFLKLCFEKAALKIISGLELMVQEKLKEEIGDIGNADDARKIMQKYITVGEFETTLGEVVKEQMVSYLQYIKPQLDESKLRELNRYFSTK
jgi:hypothetical protein